VTSPGGALVARGKAFAEDLFVVDIRSDMPEIPFGEEKYPDIEAGLCLGLRDYLGKCGFQRVHLALSGGIDSSVVAVLAARSLGPGNVTAFALPSRYSSEGSRTDARELCKRLGMEIREVSIEEPFTAFMKVLEPVFRGRDPDVTEENLQARIRGTLVMAYSNKFPASLLLATGNKSELATGYCTLYGDMNGSLGVIGDLFKTEVYELARHLNRDREVIPEAVLQKAPSAELRPDQVDQDSLPPYDLLDRILTLYLLQNKTRGEIVGEGLDPGTVDKVLRMVGKAEYKRRQAPPVLKVSARAFGTGRRMPIARHIYEV
jgi:NAD+ synthase (glutamine-hydrolysing)